jgi:hypothetical protein
MRYSEAEQCFIEDIREKRKAANGVHSKTGKNGYTGKILFPTDLMSRKEKYNHRKAGKILTTNLYDTILPIAEFEKLEPYEQRNRLAYIRGMKGAKEIQAEMGINSKRYYEIVAALNLPKAPRTKGGDTTTRTAKVKTTAGEIKATAITIQPELDLTPIPAEKVIEDGLQLTFKGTFSAEQIIKQFLKYGSLLEGEEDRYYVELKLVQKHSD